MQAKAGMRIWDFWTPAFAGMTNLALHQQNRQI
jgi:hypothetical protein